MFSAWVVMAFLAAAWIIYIAICSLCICCGNKSNPLIQKRCTILIGTSSIFTGKTCLRDQTQCGCLLRTYLYNRPIQLLARYVSALIQLSSLCCSSYATLITLLQF